MNTALTDLVPLAHEVLRPSLLVTVVIPAYNAVGLIGACLESVVSQEGIALEVLVMDGGSRDGTLNILHGFACLHPIVRWVSEPDLGIYDAMNKGVAQARGEWIYLMGCDDRLAGSDVLAALQPSLRSDIDFVHAKIRRMSNGTVQGGPVNAVDVILHNICQQGILYRRSLFDQIGGFDLRYPICADWCFNIRCFGLPCRVAHVDLLLCHYDGAGLSTRVTDERFYVDRMKIVMAAFNTGVLGSIFTPLRYLLLEASQDRARQGQMLAAICFRAAFGYHGVRARFGAVKAAFALIWKEPLVRRGDS